MIVVDLVGGFLGAGKTTWLERVAQREPDRYDGVIVNEVAATGIDDSTLERAFPGRVVLLSGACICCDAAEQLRGVLHDLVVTRHQRTTSSEDDHVVIETSGVSDPHALVSLIEDDPVLSANIRIRQVIVLVSAVAARRQLRHRPLAQRQVALADVVYVSCSDLVEEDVRQDAVAAVRALNAEAAVRDARTEELLPAPAQAPMQLASPDQGAGVRTWSTALGPHTAWAEYAVWLHLMTQSHPESLLRSKAVLPSADGPMLVQSVGGTVLPVTAAPPDADYRAACVVVDVQVSRVERSFSAFVPSAGEGPRTA